MITEFPRSWFGQGLPFNEEMLSLGFSLKWWSAIQEEISARQSELQVDRWLLLGGKISWVLKA